MVAEPFLGTLTAEQDGEAVTELAATATFNIKYSAAQVDTYVPMSSIKLYWYDEEAGEWTNEGISIIAKTASAMTCTTKHMGNFAILGTPELCVDFEGPSGVGPEDVMHIARYQNSPYRYLVGQYDIASAEGGPDGAITGDDIGYVYSQAVPFDGQKAYCSE